MTRTRLAKGFSLAAPTRAISTGVRWDPSGEALDIGVAVVERLPAFEIFERPLLISPLARRALSRRIQQSRALNLHMPFPFVEAPAVRQARRARVPTILTYHMDAELGSGKGSRAARLVTRAYRRWSAHPALENCDFVVSNSLGYARASPVLSKHLDRVRVVPKGVDPTRLGIGPWKPNPKVPGCVAGIRNLETSKRVLFVGRLVPYKGVDVLLEAFAALRVGGLKADLLVAGGGPLRPALEGVSRNYGVDGHVHFLGFVPDRDLGDLYRFADVVVVPSLGSMESSSTVLEEAVACGTPIVGSALPGASESLPDDGIRGRLVPPGNAGSLTDAITRTLSLGKPAPPKEVRTWEDVVSDYLHLFRELGVSI